MDAWNYSIEIGKFPTEQLSSVITLLDKQGKDPRVMNNLRPISLTNCDIKIFTKALSNRLTPILPEVIHENQVAYVKGRQVHDNLNFINFCKNKSVSDNVNLAIISLDAKKAFDSVDHDCLYTCLLQYGFDTKFINIVKLMYSNLSATILMNGYFTNKISINQSVKQGDALSCALFILCIDPVIRHLNLNNVTQNPVLGAKNHKLPSTVGYADDIAVLVKADSISVQETFKIYEQFSHISGLHLNAEKTEVLSLILIELDILVYGKVIKLKDIKEVKICGKVFSYDTSIDNKRNIAEKIDKLEKKLQIWQGRPLTTIGKILITKTFGLSQIIFFMQCCNFEDTDFERIEGIIKTFVFNNKRPKLRLSKYKVDYNDGGLRYPDPKGQFWAMKIKQNLRYDNINHPIKLSRQSSFDTLSSYQPTLEKIMLKKVLNIMYDQCIKSENEMDNRIINSIVSAPVGVFAKECCKNALKLIATLYKIKTVKEMINEIIFPRNDSDKMLLFMIKYNFIDKKIMDEYNNYTCITDQPFEYWYIDSRVVSENKLTSNMLYWLIVGDETTRTTVDDINLKYKINYVPNFNPFKNLKKIKSIQNRFSAFKVLHKLIYSNNRLNLIGLRDNNKCERCGEVENTEHLLYKCESVLKMWENIVKIIENATGQVQDLNFEKIIFGTNSKNDIIIEHFKNLLIRKKINYISKNTIRKEIDFLLKIESWLFPTLSRGTS